MSKNKTVSRVWLAAAGVLVAASCAVPAWADELSDPVAGESTSEPSGTSEPTAEPTETETSEPTAEPTAEPTETSEPTSEEKPAPVTVTKTETPAPTTTARPVKDEPVKGPCELSFKYRPVWCLPTVTEAAR